MSTNIVSNYAFAVRNGYQDSLGGYIEHNRKGHNQIQERNDLPPLSEQQFKARVILSSPMLQANPDLNISALAMRSALTAIDGITGEAGGNQKHNLVAAMIAPFIDQALQDNPDNNKAAVASALAIINSSTNPALHLSNDVVRDCTALNLTGFIASGLSADKTQSHSRYGELQNAVSAVYRDAYQNHLKTAQGAPKDEARYYNDISVLIRKWASSVRSEGVGAHRKVLNANPDWRDFPGGIDGLRNSESYVSAFNTALIEEIRLASQELYAHYERSLSEERKALNSRILANDPKALAYQENMDAIGFKALKWIIEKQELVFTEFNKVAGKEIQRDQHLSIKTSINDVVSNALGQEKLATLKSVINEAPETGQNHEKE